MKPRIQVTLAALLLAALAAGCTPACTSEDGQHTYGKWEYRPADAWYKFSHSIRVCETCGWTESRTQE